MAQPPSDDRSLYALLGVAPGASDDEIRRAYRQLATTLHPDKVANAAHHDEAATLFTRIQEAYEVGVQAGCARGEVLGEGRARSRQELHCLQQALPPRRRPAAPNPRAPNPSPPPAAQVLSDPAKRDIYDVYGREGLAAGLEVGDRLKSRDELRAEWEAFQSKQKKEALEAAVNYRGVYVFKVDATGAAPVVVVLLGCRLRGGPGTRGNQGAPRSRAALRATLPPSRAARPAAALVSPYMPSLPRTPELTNIYMTSGLDVPLESRDWPALLASEQDVAHLGGAGRRG